MPPLGMAESTDVELDRIDVNSSRKPIGVDTRSRQGTAPEMVYNPYNCKILDARSISSLSTAVGKVRSKLFAGRTDMSSLR